MPIIPTHLRTKTLITFPLVLTSLFLPYDVDDSMLYEIPNPFELSHWHTWQWLALWGLQIVLWMGIVYMVFSALHNIRSIFLPSWKNIFSLRFVGLVLLCLLLSYAYLVLLLPKEATLLQVWMSRALLACSLFGVIVAHLIAIQDEYGNAQKG